MTPQPSDWRHLAEQPSKETDPRKLMSLVDQLNRVLEQSELSSGHRPTRINLRYSPRCLFVAAARFREVAHRSNRRAIAPNSEYFASSN